MIVKISEDLKELIPGYLENRSKDILLLKDYLFQKRYSEAKKVVHALKGVLGSYGFKEAYEISVEIEKSLIVENYSLAADKVAILDKYMRELEIEYTDEEF